MNPQAVEKWWITNGRVIIGAGIVRADIAIQGDTIAAVWLHTGKRKAARGRGQVDLSNAFLGPGLIDLHVWGAPEAVSHHMARFGTTAFLSTLGPEPAQNLLRSVAARTRSQELPGALAIGLHLEGPFVSRKRPGALPVGSMRAPAIPELRQLQKASGDSVRLVTLAPELPGALAATRWLRKQGVQVSLGHSLADAAQTLAAVRAGARLVTHIFNGMRVFHHRQSALVDVALTHPDLTTMVILDGRHVSPNAFRLLVRTKGVDKIILVTDSIRFQGWNVRYKNGAYRMRSGILAGSALTLMRAVENAVRFADLKVDEAVRMASAVPARLLGLRGRGEIRPGARADLMAFDDKFRVLLTVVGGRIVYQRQEARPSSA